MTDSPGSQDAGSNDPLIVSANAAVVASTVIVQQLTELGLPAEPVCVGLAATISSGVAAWHTARGARALQRLLRSRPEDENRTQLFLEDLRDDESLQDLVIDAFEAMTRTSSDRKLSAMAQIVWGHRKAAQTSVTRRQILLAIVRKLSDWHWLVLEHLAGRPRYVVDGPADDLQMLVEERVYPRATRELAGKLPGCADEFTSEFLWMIVMQLEQWGLIKHDDTENWPDQEGPQVKGWQQVPLTEVGEQVIRLLRLESVEDS